MGFKLGKTKKPHAVNGEIKSKFRFHKEAGDPELSVPGTPVIRKKLAPGVIAEANMDGSIYLSNKIDPDSLEAKQALNHEMRHATDLRIGKLQYTDNYIKYNGEKFERKTMSGKDMIQFEGKWVEAGSHNFPWEKEANHGIM